MAKGHEGATAEKGPWVFTLDMPSYQAVLMHAENRPLRKELYRAFITRASTGSSDNGPLIERTLALKRERAQLLGYPNHAEVSLASKMATLATAERLLEELRSASYEPAKAELEDVRAMAAAAKAPEAGDLKHWDVTFWAERLREVKFQLKEEELRPYFALPQARRRPPPLACVADVGALRVLRRQCSADRSVRVASRPASSLAMTPNIRRPDPSPLLLSQPLCFAQLDSLIRCSTACLPSPRGFSTSTSPPLTALRPSGACGRAYELARACSCSAPAPGPL